MGKLLRTRNSIVLCAVPVVVLTLTAGAAGAAPPTDPGTTASAVHSHRASESEILKAAARMGAERRRALVGTYVSEQARSGRLVDAKNVRAADVAGGQLIWERGSVVEEVRVDKHVYADAGGDGAEVAQLGLVSHEDPSVEGAGVATLTGTGMADGADYGGGILLADSCPQWYADGNKILACWEKFRPYDDGSETRDYYMYNRFGTATGGVVDWAPDWTVMAFSMRSRPYDGYEYRTKGMTRYFPVDSEQLCGAGPSVNLGAGSLSLTIPLSSCSYKEPDVDSYARRMGVVYDTPWWSSGSRTRGIEYTQTVWTSQALPSTYLGYYNYAHFCRQLTFTSSAQACSNVAGNTGWY